MVRYHGYPSSFSIIRHLAKYVLRAVIAGMNFLVSLVTLTHLSHLPLFFRVIGRDLAQV